ncbi:MULTISPECIES: restriction endonuclease subunit S [Pacificibacter]|uniref:restriction endonuclease subunit S n=1 Tax=Pacificibacter TaxID=1042323 RepID=UPI001C09022C|nr:MULTISPECIES: restriction endonuclease subunit S [Pacificibacter]MBU2934541.1 restriction endonuclease subunit S [Pacificibacter marinus]MDO6617187.1 restriction endonuclease subunit S [Pacificibacter sp. 1_MG-2023]
MAAGQAKYRPYPAYKPSGVEWLGDIPEGWGTFQFKRTVDGCVNGFWGDNPDGGTNDTIVVRVADFDRPKLSLVDDGYSVRSIRPSEKANRKLSYGDLLIEKSGGGEKTLVGQVVQFQKTFEAVTSNFVAKMSPLEHFDSSFLTYAFHTAYSINLNLRSVKQSTGIQNLDSNAYLSETWTFPPLSEQTKIAAFLDHETAKIDGLIAKQERLIALLEEKRQAVISHAVTKGLDKSAPLRPSGIDWLGDVPAHWRIGRVGLVCSYISYGFTNPMPTTDAGPYMLTAADIEFGAVNYQSARRTSDLAFRTKLSPKSKPEIGDILITKDGTLGRVALVRDEEEICISQSIALLRVDPDEIFPEYLESLLSAEIYQKKMIFDAGGTTIKHIYISILARMNLTIPPYEEQKMICDTVKLRSRYFDQIDNKAQSAITLLKERRTALISAAVTGKIDLRDWQAPEGAQNSIAQDISKQEIDQTKEASA